MSNVSTQVLDKCAELFQAGRKNLLAAAGLLYKIKQEELYKVQFETFTEYVEEQCLMDIGQASRLLTTFEHYVVKGGLEPAQLAEINPEKLYLARSLEGSPQQQSVKALTLSKQELKSQRILEQTGEEHEHEPVSICKTCHQRLG